MIWDLEFGICDLGFGIWDLGFGIWDLGFGIWDLEFGHIEFKIQDSSSNYILPSLKYKAYI